MKHVQSEALKSSKSTLSLREEDSIEKGGKSMIPETTRALGDHSRTYRPRDRAVAGRLKIERLLHELYAARVRGDLDRVCRSFA
jgi:hypothetical protein